MTGSTVNVGSDEADSLDAIYLWGSAYLELIVDSSWVHREIESVFFEAAEITRKISLDLTVPHLPQWPQGDPLLGGAGQVAVPLRFMPKGILRNFSIALHGDPVPLLTSRDNATIVTRILHYLIYTLGLPEIHRDQLLEIASAAVRCDSAAGSEEHRDLLAAFDRVTNELPEQFGQMRRMGLLHDLITLLMSNFLMFAVIPASDVGARRVIKYSHEWDNTVFTANPVGGCEIHYTANVNWNCSYHLEVHLPAGVRVQRVTCRELRAPAGAEVPFLVSRSGNLGHVLATAEMLHDRQADLEVRVGVAPEKQGLRRFSWWAAVALFALITFANGARYLDAWVGPVSVPSPSVSLLLVWPAVMLSWLARETENNVVALVRAAPRYVLIMASMIIFGLAGIAAVPVAPMVWNAVWWVANVASLIVLTYAIVAEHTFRNTDGVSS